MVNCINLHVGFVFRAKDLTSRVLDLGRVHYPCLTLSILFNQNVQEATRHLCHVRSKTILTNLMPSGLVRVAWSVCFSNRRLINYRPSTVEIASNFIVNIPGSSYNDKQPAVFHSTMFFNKSLKKLAIHTYGQSKFSSH